MDDGVEEGLRGAEPGEAVERVAAEEIDVAGGADTRRLSRAVRDASRDAGGVWRVLTVLGSLQTWRGSDGAGGRVGGEWWRRIRCDVLRLGRCGRADRRRASVGEVCIDYIRARARARRRGSRKQWELLTQTVGFRGGPPRKDGWRSRAGRGSPWARRRVQGERGARGVREPSQSEAQERADRPGTCGHAVAGVYGRVARVEERRAPRMPAVAGFAPAHRSPFATHNGQPPNSTGTGSERADAAWSMSVSR